jgi:hypothetical protein
LPTGKPTSQPSNQPSCIPTSQPTAFPTTTPRISIVYLEAPGTVYGNLEEYATSRSNIFQFQLAAKPSSTLIATPIVFYEQRENGTGVRAPEVEAIPASFTIESSSTRLTYSFLLRASPFFESPTIVR